MGVNSEFLIPFKGLENGIHEYRFQVSTEFFEKFENSRIQKGNYQVDLVFDKRDQMMVLDFSFEGTYHASCDRCLAMIDIPNLGDDQVIVKLQSDVSQNDNDDVIILEDDAHQIDISDIVYNMIHLFLPLTNERDCESEDYKYCDHSVLDKIEYTSDEEDEKDGGNWDILKNLNLD